MKFMSFMPAVIAMLGVSANASAALDAKAANVILTKAGCTACHQVEKKMLGPSYKDVSTKYKGNAKAGELLTQKVRSGGTGTWGAIPMPPNTK